jgi:hypothetical protein
MGRWSPLAVWVALAGCDPWISPDDRTDGFEGIWHVQFAPMIDLSPCRAGLSWCCQTVNVDGDGSFSVDWAPNEPNTARFEGVLGEDGLDATLQCIGNATSTAIEAEPRGGAYDGDFAFGTSSGCLFMYPEESTTVSLQGQVFDFQTAAPIGGATVWTSLQDRIATTNEHGQFYLSLAVEPEMGDTQSYTVRAWAPGYQEFAQDAVWGDHPRGLSLQIAPL